MNEWLLLQDGIYVYTGLALLLVGGAFGLPIPEDIPLILGGVLVNHGRARLDVLFLVAYTSILVGDLIIYGIGYRFGFSLFKSKYLSSKIPPERITRINQRLERHAISMIFLARHLFYLRTATLFACGAFRMSVIRFVVIDAFAAAMSTSIMVGLGYLASEHLAQVFAFLHGVKTASLVIGLIALVFIIFSASL